MIRNSQSLEHQQQVGAQQNIDNQDDEVLKAHKGAEKLATSFFIAATVLIIVVLFFVVSAVFSADKSLQSLLTSIATSLVASLVFTSLYTTVVENARRKSESRTRALEIESMRQITSSIVTEATNALFTEIEGRINKMLEEEATRLVGTWPELLPKDYFPPSSESDPHFMEKLGAAVAMTQHYIFRGATGRFVPALLRQYAQPDLSCSILIIDPRADTAIQIYALNRYVKRDKGKTLEEFEEEIRQEIYIAIVDLFDLRQHFRIELSMCHDNLFYRSEIVDEGVFVSFYVGDRKMLYPPTYFYTKANGGFYYSAFRRDFQQSWNVAKERFTMRVDMTQDALEEFLYKIGAGDKATLPTKIAEWRNRQRQV